MNEERAIEILVVVAKKFMKDNMPTGITKLMLSDHQLKMAYEIQQAIEVLEPKGNQKSIEKTAETYGIINT